MFSRGFCSSGSSLIHKSTIESHANDLAYMLYLLGSEREASITAIGLVVDGGPDWCVKSKTTVIYLFRLFVWSKVSTLLAAGFGPTQSKFNPIEHDWEKRAKELNSVRFSACAYGDTHQPNKLPLQSRSKLEQIAHVKQQEAKMMDTALTDLSGHWNGRSTGGSVTGENAQSKVRTKVFAQGVGSCTPMYPWNDLSKVQEYSKSGQNKIRKAILAPGHSGSDPALVAIHDEYSSALAHLVKRSATAVCFVRCNKPECTVCCATHDTILSHIMRERSGLSTRPVTYEKNEN